MSQTAQEEEAATEPLNDAESTLAEENYQLTSYMVRLMIEKGTISRRDQDEALGHAVDALIDATRKYRPNVISPRTGRPVQFTTYACNAIWRRVYQRTILRNKHKRLKLCGTPEALRDLRSDSPRRHAERSESVARVHNAIGRMAEFNPLRATIIREWLRTQGTNREVARAVGCSHQAVDQAKHKFYQFVREARG